MNSSVTRVPSCFYLKFVFTFPGASWSRRRLFLTQSHLVKFTAISNSQAGTPGPATEASCPVGSYSGMFVLDIQEGFLADSLPSWVPLCWAMVVWQPVFMPLIKEQRPQILQSSMQTGLGSNWGLLNLNTATLGNEMLRDFENGNWGYSFFFSLSPFYFSSDIWIDWLS